MKKKDGRTTRAAIVKAAAERCICTIEEIFARAVKFENALRKAKGGEPIRNVVVNLKKIPRYVAKFARMVLDEARAFLSTPNPHQRYFRAAPALNIH